MIHKYLFLLVRTFIILKVPTFFKIFFLFYYMSHTKLYSRFEEYYVQSGVSFDESFFLGSPNLSIAPEDRKLEK